MNFVNYQYIVLAYAVVILGTRDSEVLRTVTRSRAIMYWRIGWKDESREPLFTLRWAPMLAGPPSASRPTNTWSLVLLAA